MQDKRQDFWERLGAKRFAPGKGVTQPPPEKGWKRFVFVLTTHFRKLVFLNLLFLAFAIPIVTIPAAFCGMNRVLMKLYREGNCFVWTEFIKEFRANLFKAVPFSAIGALCIFAAYYFLSLGTSMSSNRIELITTALGILLLGVTVLFLSYVFVFLPTLDLQSGQIARNAFIFLLTEWRTNFIILGGLAATVLFAVSFFPYTLFPLFFISISFLQYVVCAAVNGPLQSRIIGPYERRKEQTPNEQISVKQEIDG